MNSNKWISGKYWIYIAGFFVLLLFFSLLYVDTEGFAIAIFSAIVAALLITLWLMVIHHLWFSDSLLLKILALLIGGLVAVLIVVLIQFVYEKTARKQ